MGVVMDTKSASAESMGQVSLAGTNIKSRLIGTASALVLSGAVCAPAIAQDETAADRGLDTIVVTATKREENIQDISVSVQTLGEKQLDELNVKNFDDYVRYLPTVNAAGRGPGQSSIFIRGVATDSSDQTSLEIGAPVPNVALYLDEQPVSTTGRNLDVYAADLERVEVLPGPQGTLYGASSQAGTVRLITNKPEYNQFGGKLSGSLATTKSGELSNTAELVLNVPLIQDKLAIRGVIYRADEGGYIDNVLGEATFDDTALSFPAGGTSTTIDNAQFVEEDFNDATYTGGRVALGFKPHENWEILATYLNQRLDVEGVFDHSPELLADLQIPGEPPLGRVVGDLQVQRFAEDVLVDEFQQYALTLKGRIGALDIIYAASFLDREVNNSFDYITYNNVGSYASYYVCLPDYVNCGDPTLFVDAFIENERRTHEIRATYDIERLKITGGLFFDKSETGVNTEFVYPQAAGNLPQNAPISTSTQFISGPRAPGTTFVNDAIKSEKQFAVFGELKYQIVEDLVAASFGARYYDIESRLVGSSNFATFGATDGDDGVDFDALFGPVSPLEETGTVFKGTLEVTPTSDILLYAAYSEGFRPGGFNRIDSAGVPLTYGSDDLKNYELGWKTEFLDGSLRFNGAAYYLDISGLQVGITDLALSVLTFTANAVDARVYGVEADIAYAATDNLTIFSALAFNDTEITNLPGTVVDIAPEGSELALAPRLQFNIRPRYEWRAGSAVDMYAQIVFSYTGEQFSSIVAANRYPQDSYISLDGSIGGRINDSFSFEFFAENLTDERAQLFINTLDTDLRVTTNRPRTLGIRGSYEF